MAQQEAEIVEGIGSDYAAKYGFSNPDEAEDYFFKSGRGISHDVVEAIAEHKSEPAWMRKVRHQALDYFFARPMPSWGGDLSGIDFDNIYYYIRPTEKQANSWDELPAISRPPGTSSGSRRPRRNTWRGSVLSTNPRSSTTTSRRS